MSEIRNDDEFRSAIHGLGQVAQRVLAARFLESILPLSNDERITGVMQVAARTDASEAELENALHLARAVAMDTYTRCGAECDWREQAGYFVARTAIATVTPAGQMAGGPAWQAAMSSRMARTCKSIELEEDTAGQERQEQYRILSAFIDTQRDVL